MAESKIGKRGRPSTRDAEGFTEHMRKLLNYKKAHPLASKEEACRETGVALNTFKRYWKNRTNVDELFKQRWRGYEHVLAKGPPDPGTFIEFRGEALNVASFNPYTGKVAMVGQTHDYMKAVCEALDDDDERLVLILLPVRFAKTTLMEQKAAHRWARNPNDRQLWVTSNIKHVKERAYNIQRMLLDTEVYPELHSKWGPWLGKPDDTSKPWQSTSFYIRGRNSPERSPSFSGYGISSKVYGARADFIVLDDVDDPDNGDQERDSIMRNITGPIMSRLTEGGRLIYIGTRVGVNDVPSRLIEMGGWKVIQLAAYKEDGSPLCPEMYGEEELERFRLQMGEEMFQMMLMNNPSPEGSSLFPPDLVDSAKSPFDDAPEEWRRVVSIDPAVGGRAAIVCVAYDPESRVKRVIDVEALNNPRHDGLFDALQRFVLRHRPETVVIEAQGGSAWFSEAPNVRSFIYDEVHGPTPLIEFHTTGKNKHEAAFGVPMLASEMVKERLRICWGEASRGRMKPLVEDLVAYQPHGSPKRKYDTVMATWFAVSTIQEGIKRSSRRGVQRQSIVTRYPWLRNRRPKNGWQPPN